MNSSELKNQPELKVQKLPPIKLPGRLGFNSELGKDRFAKLINDQPEAVKKAIGRSDLLSLLSIVAL